MKAHITAAEFAEDKATLQLEQEVACGEPQRFTISIDKPTGVALARWLGHVVEADDATAQD